VRAYIIRRLLMTIPTFLGISLITFLVIHLTPGNPAMLALQGDTMGKGYSAANVAEMKQILGLDRPLYVQYFDWLDRMVRFDFGESLKDHRKVIDKILEALPNTLLLNVISLILIYLISLPLGIISAVKQNSWVDKSITSVLFVLYSLPAIWIALLLILLFYVRLDWLPAGGLQSLEASDYSFLPWLWDRLMHIILPVTCFTYAGFAVISRYVRSSMLEVIRQDYIRTARAKGLSENKVIYKHGLSNALIPIVTLLGLELPGLLGGSVILEQIFAWPGLGWLFFDALNARDYTTIMGLTVFTAILVLLGTLLADILYAVVDPRVHYD
jgi:peptide/nickel transport system permease protein